MYCSKCGAQVSDGELFCGKCGTPLNQTTQASVLKTSGTSITPQQNNDQGTAVVQRTSGFAIASLILGIIMFVPFSQILAIIFGAIALSQISKTPNLKGRGMAIAGLCLGIFWIVLGVLAGAFYIYGILHAEL